MKKQLMILTTLALAACGSDKAADTATPEDATLTGVAIELETRLDEIAAANPNPGRRSFQRLNRAEMLETVASQAPPAPAGPAPSAPRPAPPPTHHHVRP